MSLAIARYVPFLVLVVGCAGTAMGPDFRLETPTADKATMYIYRPTRDFNRPGYPEVFLNGEKKFALLDNGYEVLSLPPGQYEVRFEGATFRTNWWPPVATRSITVQPGREYFIRAFPTLPPGQRPGNLLVNNISYVQIDLVTKDQAVQEMKEVKRVSR